MLFVRMSSLVDSPFSKIRSVFWVSVLSLCLSSVGAMGCWLYLARKWALGGQARRVVGRESGMGCAKNSSVSTSSIESLCLGSFWSILEMKCLVVVAREIWSGKE